jgi:hypothetical protein
LKTKTRVTRKQVLADSLASLSAFIQNVKCVVGIVLYKNQGYGSPQDFFFFFFPLLADYLEEAGSSANKRLPTADSLAAWSSYVDILFDVVSKYGAASS